MANEEPATQFRQRKSCRDSLFGIGNGKIPLGSTAPAEKHSPLQHETNQMASKNTRLKARLPRGLTDRPRNEVRATDRIVEKIRTVYELYGFDPLETPAIEYTDSLGKFLPDLDRPNEGVFSFHDDDEQWLSLRYDLTAPLARYVAQNLQALPRPFRSYRFGWVFRNEKPGPGRFRQFMQFDADTVGAGSAAADAEMCMMVADTMEALGIERGTYRVKLNSRKVLDAVMAAAGIGGPGLEGKRLTVLRAIDKLDRLGLTGVEALLGEGRKDESGDITQGAGLDTAQAGIILAALEGDMSTLSKSEAGEIGQSDLNEISAICRASGFSDDRIRVDASVVRGLEYYTGAIFEAELLTKIPNEKGQPVVFGSVGGGGRYDGLVGRFINQEIPATGVSIGVSRLAAALSALGQLDDIDAAGPVVVLVMDRDRVPQTQKMVTDLRAAGIAAEMYVGDSGVKAQMKYADRRNAPLAVIQGEDERDRGVIQIKDLVVGKQLSETISDNAQWREERPGQFEVPEADLIAAVRKVLGSPSND
jgi:histidyl-tRNA synthetase